MPICAFSGRYVRGVTIANEAIAPIVILQKKVMKTSPYPLRSKRKTRILINPQGLPLSPEKLRELSGLEVTDEKAMEIIHSIQLLCKILYQISNSRKNGYIESETDNPNQDYLQNLAA